MAQGYYVGGATGICPSCGEPLTPGADFCMMCGTRLGGAEPQAAAAEASQATAGFCMQCGAPLLPGATFCDMCGAKVEPAAAPRVPVPAPAQAPAPAEPSLDPIDLSPQFQPVDKTMPQRAPKPADVPAPASDRQDRTRDVQVFPSAARKAIDSDPGFTPEVSLGGNPNYDLGGAVYDLGGGPAYDATYVSAPAAPAPAAPAAPAPADLGGAGYGAGAGFGSAAYDPYDPYDSYADQGYASGAPYGGIDQGFGGYDPYADPGYGAPSGSSTDADADDDDPVVRPQLITITREEARSGCTKMVTIDGQQTSVTIPAGVDVTTKLDIPNLGYFDEMTGRRGPLRLTFFVV